VILRSKMFYKLSLSSRKNNTQMPCIINVILDKICEEVTELLIVGFLKGCYQKDKSDVDV